MTTIKKIKVLLPFLTSINPLSVGSALAQDNAIPTHGERVEDFAGKVGLSSAPPTTIIENSINIALSFLAIICLILIIYSGFIWMTSAGNEEKVKRAKSILKNAIIGAIIVLFSFVITTTVFEIIGDKIMD